MSTQDVTGADLFAPLRGSGNPGKEPRVECKESRGLVGVGGLLDTVQLGDNVTVLSTLPAECIDLVVTSPPYDDLRTYGGHSWDFAGVASELTRVLKPGGVIVWVVADATVNGSETGTSMRQAIRFMELGMKLHDTMIWEKTGSGCMGSPYCYAQNYEFMFVLAKGKAKTANMICDRENVIKSGSVKVNGVNGGIKKDGTYDTKIIERKPFGKRTNIWRIQPAQKTGHPAAYPMELATDHIRSWSNPGDVVLDPFAGSGTTLKAAKELNRHWLGIEINSDYVEICKARLSQDALSLFSGGGGAEHGGENGAQHSGAGSQNA